MAKVSGLGSAVIVQDGAGEANTISNDVTNYSFTTPRGTQDITGVDKSAHEMLLLLADFTVTLNGVFNTADDMSHDTFSTIPSTSPATRSVEIDPTGATTGAASLVVNCILTDYQITRANTGDLTWQVPGQLSDGAVPTWTTHA
jgi:hypothetical protein